MVIYLFGQNTYLSRQKLKAIIDEYQKNHQLGLELTRFIDKVDWPRLISKITSVSMFAEKKLIVFEDIIDEQLIELIKANKISQSQEIIFVVYQGSVPDKRTSFYKFLNKKPNLVQGFEALRGLDLENWLKREVSCSGGQIDNDAIKEMIFLLGDNLWLLKNEIDKLLAYHPVITDKSIKLLIRARFEADIFRLTDAIGHNNKSQVFKFLHGALAQGESPIYLLTMFNYQLRLLLKLKDLDNKSVPMHLWSKQLNLHPFVVKKTSSQLRNFNIIHLKGLYNKLLDIDTDLKSGRLEPIIALDLFVNEI